ncbi:MFS transporter [Sporolactobacillus pectinivorans]|uniref:MFS transporter n=1 Tax=Sporolactobacillus pectinivorans TaxID=1591408 RepID=UPI000C260098|nr:MFS transporter [Sporolactobacillus pectinivorans]
MARTFSIFKNKHYTLLFSASVTSQLGSVIGMTALVFYLLDRFSNQPYLATFNELMSTLPSLLIFWLVGVAADRMDRQKIAANCDLISAGLSLGLLVSLLTHLLWLIFAMIFLRAAVSKFFAPAEQAIIQGVLKKEDYPVAAGLNQMISSLFMIFGNGLGAVVYWRAGAPGAILIDTLSFIVSAILIRSLKISSEVRLPNGSHIWRSINLEMIKNDFSQGFHYIAHSRLLISLIASFAIFGIINGGCSVMLIFILKYKLAPDAYQYISVWGGVVSGIGILAGSLLASLFSGKWSYKTMIVSGLTASGSFIIAAGYAPNVVVFLVLMFFSTLFIPFVNVAIGGWMPCVVDPKMMGRVESWSTPIMMLFQSLTLGLIMAAFPAWISIESIFLIVGSLTFLSAIYYTFFVRESLDRIAAVPTVRPGSEA